MNPPMNDAPAPASVEAVKEIEATFRRHLQANDYAKDLIKRIAFDVVPLARKAALSPPPTVGAEDEAKITARYTNWRGETAERTFIPRRVFFGSNEWHPEPQVLIEATDCEKGALRTFAAAGFATRPAPAADGQRVKDGRPEGWTEALAISFMAANGHNPEMGMFAKSFNEGAWRKIKDEWPEFVEFVSVHIRACLATDKEGA